jgi:superfamily II DNA or RNA helicase
MFETGLGKTLTTIAGLIMRKNSGRSKRILWLSPLDILEQTWSVFRRNTSFKSTMITGTSRGMRKRDMSSIDVTFMNFEAFDERHILEWMTDAYADFDTVVVDEAHMIANPFSSNRNGFLWWLAGRVQNTYLLTATPVISRIDQYAGLICCLTGTLKDLLSYRSQIHQKKWLPGTHPNLISYKQRNAVIPIEVIEFEEEIRRSRVHGTALFKDTRNRDTEKPYQILSSIIRENELKHFLVYSNLTEHHKELQDFLEADTGLRVSVMSGDTKDKSGTQKAFNAGEIDVLVFSTTSGRDLPAESVIFFEWDVYASQSLGRAVRSKEVRKDFIVWFLVNTLYETDMFRNTVIKTGLLNEKALGKNIFKNIF